MAINQILQFAGGGGANVVTQTAYANLIAGALANGYPASYVLPSNVINKVHRQNNFMAAGLASFIAAKGYDVLDDGNLSTLVSNLTLALAKGTNFADTSGAANTLTATPAPAFTAYTDGMLISIRVANTNTGASTLNLNGLGAKNIVYRGNALVGGELSAAGEALFIYDATDNQFELLHSQITATSGRTRLSTNMTYYVATTGNDTTGTGTSGNPWATIQKAMNYLYQSVDLNGYLATVQVADGTYSVTNAPLITCIGPFVGVGGANTVLTSGVYLKGNLTTPANCVLQTLTSGDILDMNNRSVLQLGGFKIQAASQGFAVNSGALLLITGAMEYGVCGSSHLYALNQGNIGVSANYKISGGAPTHWNTGNFGLIQCLGNTITLTGTPNFTAAFAIATLLGEMDVAANTFSGGATGVRYSVQANAVIQTGGGGANYLPGNNIGATATGGQYV